MNELFDLAWANHVSIEFEPILSRSLVYLCAYSDERIVGFINVAWEGGCHAFLLDTTVHPEYQRRSIGRSLVEMAVREATQRGATWLHVDYEPHLREFYQQCGFISTEAGLINLRERG